MSTTSHSKESRSAIKQISAKRTNERITQEKVVRCISLTRVAARALTIGQELLVWRRRTVGETSWVVKDWN